MPIEFFETLDLNFTQEKSARVVDNNLMLSRLHEAVDPSPYTTARRGDTHFPQVLYPQFHVLTADKVTRNSTLYTTNSHRGSKKESTGQYSYTKPYPIPIIKEHQASAGMCGNVSDVYGRMVDAKLVKNEATGQGYLAGLAMITQSEAIEELLTGRWLTGSLGSSVTEAHCSICNEAYNSQEDMDTHIHRKGSYYKSITLGKTTAESAQWEQTDAKDSKGRLCYTAADVYKAREYSKVLMPSDDESLVDVVDTRTQPGHAFTGKAYTSKLAPPYHDPDEAEEITPTSFLWVPKRVSHSDGVYTEGERYLDLVTGREVPASVFNLPTGKSLMEQIEKINSGDTSIEFTENITQPSTVFAGMTFKAEKEDDITAIEDVTQEEPVEIVENNEKKLTAKDRRGLKDSDYCAPKSRKFPTHDRAHYNSALRMLPKYKGPESKSSIRACILRKGKKNGWANENTKENSNSMSEQNNEETSMYALRLYCELPSGQEKTFEYFNRESVEDRLDSLASLDENDDLIASLTEDEEKSLRELLLETASGEEPTVEIEVGESNYPILAAIFSEDTSTAPTLNAEESFNDTTELMCDGSNRKETLKHFREAFKAIEEIKQHVTAEKQDQSVDILVHTITLAEMLLKSELTDEATLRTKSKEELVGLQQYLYEKAITVPVTETEEEHVEVITDKGKESPQDTIVAEAEVLNPLNTEVSTTSEIAAQPSEEEQLRNLRRTVAPLFSAEDRKKLQR